MQKPNHPAVKLGAWLKAKRQAKRVVSREFAGLIGLSPAEYAEVELGIISWLREKQRNLIPLLLGFTNSEMNNFDSDFSAAAKEKPLKFSELFTREQLTPTRLCKTDGAQLTPELREKILDAVFADL